jgi:hypothetical protein
MEDMTFEERIADGYYANTGLTFNTPRPVMMDDETKRQFDCRLHYWKQKRDERASESMAMAMKRHNEFRHDLEVHYGVPHDHPKAQKLFEMAWGYGHASGFHEVFQHYGELAELVL